jgi:flagellar hook-basal body complex protein FliE
MDLRIASTPSSTHVSTAGLRPASADKAGFANELHRALTAVSSAQNNASQLQRGIQLENPQVSLEETMVAIQKAQIGFQAALHVRNRMVQAYTDIMNMQV